MEFQKIFKWGLSISFVCIASVNAEECLKKVSLSAIQAIQVEDGDHYPADPSAWEAGSKTLFKEALHIQLKRCQNQNLKTTASFAGEDIPRSRYCIETAQWFLKEIEKASVLQDVFDKAKKELNWYQSVGKSDTHEVQFTGYDFPIYRASRVPTAEYRYPIYRLPSNLVQVRIDDELVWRRRLVNRDGSVEYIPYFTREEIVNGALNGKGLELGYLNNPIDPYILQVQGSGALIFSDGKEKTSLIVNYAGQNGGSYVSLGRMMREGGIPEEYINLQGIKRYFTQHADLWKQYSNKNPSYVFFKNESQGPYGAVDVLLTPKHSIAIDANAFTLGSIGLIQAKRPSLIEGETAKEWKSFSQFVIAQDTGGAIKTPARVDIYYGSGLYAEVAAGQTNHTGNLFFAVVPEDFQVKLKQFFLFQELFKVSKN